MTEDLYRALLSSQKIEFAEFDFQLRLVRCSPHLPDFLTTNRLIQPGAAITETFFELLGYEQHLQEVRDGRQPPLKLDWINQVPCSGAEESPASPYPAKYFNLQVFAFSGGLLVAVKDVTEESGTEQMVYNRRNELDILTRKLIDDLEHANAELNQAYHSTLEGWARALEMRDVETKGHSERVVNLTRRLACTMGVKETDIDFYCYGALLHDIGKMGIPDRILLKPGALDVSEWQVMKQHTLIGESLLDPIQYLRKALCIVACHHEKWNGEGYPYRLKGREIPLPARIFSVVDVYDALSSDRPYRQAWQQNEVLRYISDRSGIDFDPQVVETFLSLFSEETPRDIS